MATIIQKLMSPFKAMTAERLPETAKMCRDASDRYRKCADKLVEASKHFDAGDFPAGFDCLQVAEAVLDKK